MGTSHTDNKSTAYYNPIFQNVKNRDTEVPVWVLRELARAGAQGGVLQMQPVPLLVPEVVSVPPVHLISAVVTAPAAP